MIRIPKDTDNEKKFMYIETILNRFSRRLHKTVIFATPPSIISNFVKEIPEDGIILRCVFPCSGKIMGLTTVADMPKDSKFEMKLLIRGNEYTHPVSDNIPVNASDVMTVKFIGAGANINISALFIADTVAAQKETLAISALDKTSDEE